MLRFMCEHCGKSVVVDELRAGSKGRCPNCGKVVMIPGAGAEDGDNVSTLAAILSDEDDDAIAPPPPPPPPAEPDIGEFDPISPEIEAGLKTACYPAIHSDEPSAGSLPDLSREAALRVPTSTTTCQKVVLFLVAIIVVAVFGALLYWMHFL